jgi:two-component system OmpR family response regulator
VIPERSGRVLIAEAEAPVRRRLFKALLDRDVYSDPAADAGELFECLAAKSYSLIILDLALPGATTEAVLERLRAIAKNERPIVVVTGNPDGARGLDHDLVQIVLRRPIDLGQLALLAESCVNGLREAATSAQLAAARKARGASTDPT